MRCGPRNARAVKRTNAPVPHQGRAWRSCDRGRVALRSAAGLHHVSRTIARSLVHRPRARTLKRTRHAIARPCDWRTRHPRWFVSFAAPDLCLALESWVTTPAGATGKHASWPASSNSSRGSGPSRRPSFMQRAKAGWTRVSGPSPRHRREAARPGHAASRPRPSAAASFTRHRRDSSRHSSTSALFVSRATAGEH